MQVTAIAPWFDSRERVVAYALQLVADNTLSVDSDGRVWRQFVRTKRGRKPITPKRAESPTRKGYLSVVLGVPGTRVTRHVLAHVLVWRWLNGGIPEGMQVNHKDLNKANNHPDNLELVTGAGNIQHSYANGRTRPWTNATEWRPGKSVLGDEQKGRVVSLRQAGKTYRAIQRETGISQAHIGRILKGAEQCK